MPNPAWLPAYDALIARVPGLLRLGGSRPYTAVDGEVFSFMTAEGQLALRLPEEAREYVMERFGATPCVHGGKPMAEFVVVTEALWERPDALAGCFEASHAYASGLET